MVCQQKDKLATDSVTIAAIGCLTCPTVEAIMIKLKTRKGIGREEDKYRKC